MHHSRAMRRNEADQLPLRVLEEQSCLGEAGTAFGEAGSNNRVAGEASSSAISIFDVGAKPGGLQDYNVADGTS